MQLLYVLGGFVLGVAFTLYMFSSEIFHGTKVGYGDGDISPDKGCCGHMPPPNFPPPAPPKKQ